MKSIVLAYVCDTEGSVLLLHRHDRDQREPVKGRQEIHESPLQAMRRELHEETGMGQTHIDTYTNISSLHAKPSISATYLLRTHEVEPPISVNHDPTGGTDHDRYTRVSLADMPQYHMGPRYDATHRDQLASHIQHLPPTKQKQ